MEKTLRDLYDFVYAGVELNFKRDGHIDPVALLGDMDKGELAFVALDMSTEEAKDASAQGIKMLAKQREASFVAFVAESWMVKGKKGQKDLKSVRPSMHPNRREVVMINIESRTGHLQAVVPIIRGKGGPTLGIAEIVESPAATGRFTDLLGRSMLH